MKCENIRIIPINNLDFLSKIAISSDITSRSELVVLGKKDAKNEPHSCMIEFRCPTGGLIICSSARICPTTYYVYGEVLLFWNEGEVALTCFVKVQI